MNVGLAVVLVIINLIGLIIIGHVIRSVWSYQTVHNKQWCVRVTGFATLLLFSGAVAANTFISTVYKLTP